MSRLGLHQHSRGLGQTARVYRDKGTRKPGIRPYASSAGAGGARGGSLGAFDGSSRSRQLFSDELLEKGPEGAGAAPRRRPPSSSRGCSAPLQQVQIPSSSLPGARRGRGRAETLDLETVPAPK